MFDVPSIFPQLFTYQVLGIFLIRVILGIVVFSEGKRSFGGKSLGWSEKSGRVVGLISMLAGVMLIIGLFTQIVAIVVVVLFKFPLFIRFLKKELIFFGRTFNYYSLIVAVALSLLVLGPGAFAIDLSF